MDERPRGRGRPRASDPLRISEAALGLVLERGYSATTMAEIAAAAGISLPTLFRYFPSKAGVLWYGMDDSARRFREAFGRVGDDVALVDAVFAAYLEMLVSSPERLPIVKARIAVVERDHAGDDAAWDRFEEWGRIVAEFAALRRDIPVSSLEAAVVGGMIWSALWAAITHWALGDEADPTATVEAARRAVASAF